jgi:hypothetical protein
MDAQATHLIGPYEQCVCCSFHSIQLLLNEASDIDTTKIIRGGRRFNASSKAPTQSSSTASTLWTETPAERQQRLADEIAGKRRRTENAEPEAEKGEELERAKRRRAEETVRADVDKHTVNTIASTALSLTNPMIIAES